MLFRSNNLLKRYIKAVEETNAEIVVRFPADNATPEPKEIDKIIDFHNSQKEMGFSSNLAEIFNSGYPDGIGAEVFDAKYLFECLGNNPSKEQIEHIHLNFYDYKTQKIVKNYVPVMAPMPSKLLQRPEFALDINTLDQYYFIRNIDCQIRLRLYKESFGLTTKFWIDNSSIHKYCKMWF